MPRYYLNIVAKISSSFKPLSAPALIKGATKQTSRTANFSVVSLRRHIRLVKQRRLRPAQFLTNNTFYSTPNPILLFIRMILGSCGLNNYRYMHKQVAGPTPLQRSDCVRCLSTPSRLVVV
ncbi:hypothetical protein QE152_g22555 [Popillia japonica]|uniref:Uncharacterized protein n=1 Tax=Popillia japonica TaxID=7064 RepID=A0AAW1KJW2_POPJA